MHLAPTLRPSDHVKPFHASIPPLHRQDASSRPIRLPTGAFYSSDLPSPWHSIYSLNAAEDARLKIAVARMPRPAVLTIESQEVLNDVQLFLLGPYGVDMLELFRGENTLDLHERFEKRRCSVGVYSTIRNNQLVLQTYETGSKAAIELSVLSGDLPLRDNTAAGQDLVCDFEGRHVTGTGESIRIETDDARVLLMIKPFADWTPLPIEFHFKDDSPSLGE